MNKEVQDRILYHVEAFKLSEESAKADIEWLEKRKGYKPKLPVRR